MRTPVNPEAPRPKRDPVRLVGEPELYRVRSSSGNGNAPHDDPQVQILAGARLLARHGGVVEVRILNTTKNTVAGYFDAVETLVQEVTPWNGQANIYVTLNPVAPALLARAHNRLQPWAKVTTTDPEIVRRAWFPIDLDAERPKGISSTATELKATLVQRGRVAQFLVNELGFPPVILAMSGNGAHVLVPCDLPNDKATTALFTRALKALHARFSTEQVNLDTSVFNPSRIWRLYGTLTVKGDPTPDRPHRLAQLDEMPESLHDVKVEALERLAALAPTSGSASSKSRASSYPPLDVLGAVRAKDWYRADLGEGKHGLLCPWAAEHSMDSGERETALWEPKEPGAPWGFDCKHAHCSGRTIKDLLQVLGLVASATDSPHATDMGNVTLLVETFGADFRHSKSTGWLHWDGRRWQRDLTGAIMRAAKATAQLRWEEAEATDPEQKRLRKMRRSWARKSEMTARLHAMVALAESEPSIIVTPDQLDRDRWLLTLEDGTYNLATGQLQPHRREDYITKRCPVPYEPAATCPQWQAFLDLIFNQQAELITFMQKWAGYCLTGDTRERVVIIAYGTGANGKTTFFEVLRGILGDYARGTPMSTLMVKRGESIPNDVARLAGARLVTATEGEAGQRLAESTIKAMVGGDVLMARYLNKEWFEFDPEFKVALQSNHKPVIRGVEHAIWDRVRLVPFTTVIPKPRKGKYHETLLRDEAPGILAWLLEGCRRWQADGLAQPTVVEEATQHYRAEQDRLAEFLATVCELVSGARVLFGDLYACYLELAAHGNERPVSMTAFGLALSEHGYPLKEVMGRRYRLGLVLKSAWQAWVDARRTTHRAQEAQAHTLAEADEL